jgi:hypothetical protein
MTELEIKLIAELIEAANRRFDGHLTILKFTTNWRVALHTPIDRYDIDKMTAGRTFEEAASKLLSALYAL